MVTVSLPTWFAIDSSSPGQVSFRCGQPKDTVLSQRDIDPLLSGDVVFTVDGLGSVCLTKSRLVLTERNQAWIFVFPQTLLGEFISQLDALSETGGR